jgi:thymidylate synthase
MPNIYNQIFSDLYDYGRLVRPRGQDVLELEDYTYSVEPDQIFCNLPARKLKLSYIKREFLWYLGGRLDDLSIAAHAKLWGEIAVDGEVNSNYGYYWFAKGGIRWVVNELARDPDSRRAVIPILGTLPRHLTDATKDVPCTESVAFRIRNGELRMTVHMRSQDAVFGLGNDVPCFSFLHRMVHTLLLGSGLQVQLGRLTTTATSLHVYERHFDLLLRLAAEANEPIEVPPIHGVGEVDAMLALPTRKWQPLPEQYRFFNWLLEVDDAPVG